MKSKVSISGLARLVAAAMVAAGLLNACGGGGGGGGSDDDGQVPEFAVAVQVDGVADASNPLTAGEATTIDVKSDTVLTFDSEGQTRWAPKATSSSFDVKAFSLTSKSLAVTSHVGGTVVIVFSDAADSSKTATLTLKVAPQEFAQVAAIDGEVETWDSDWTANGTTTHSQYFRRTRLLDQGRHAVQTASADGIYGPGWTLYDSLDRTLGIGNEETGIECLYDNPVVSMAYPAQVGKQWSGNATRQCGNYTIAVQYERSVDGYVRVKVPEGTHDALRIKSVLHYNNTYGSDVVKYSLESTCWWAVDLGRNVKCSYVYTDENNVETSHEIDQLASLKR